MDEGQVVGLPLGFHRVELGEASGLGQVHSVAQFVAAGLQKMVEGGRLPAYRGVALVGAAAFEQAAFLDAVVAPAEGPALDGRVECVADDGRPGESQSGLHQAFA